jgi:peptide chain release factor subunit 3
MSEPIDNAPSSWEEGDVQPVAVKPQPAASKLKFTGRVFVPSSRTTTPTAPAPTTSEAAADKTATAPVPLPTSAPSTEIKTETGLSEPAPVTIEDGAETSKSTEGSSSPAPASTQIQEPVQTSEAGGPSETLKDTEVEETSVPKTETSSQPGPSESKPRKPRDPREHVSIVFMGHVDAGKSTIAGNILYLTGQVDQRTIQKYEAEAKEKAGSSWYLAYIMDTNEDERAKGKTVEVGRAHFETNVRRFTILDAPGHKNYVPNMIGGASQADVGILVISARIGEFEAGFLKEGQTREHAILARTLGVSRLVVAINKMDEKSVRWDKDRYDSIVAKLTPFLTSVGFARKDVIYLPLSGINGHNLLRPFESSVCDWYSGPSLVQALEAIKLPRRDASAALRIPIMDRLKDAGKVIIQGKVESGTIRFGQRVILMPNKQVGTVTFLGTDLEEVDEATPGENVRFVVSGVADENARAGFVVCDVDKPCTPVSQFEAQVAVIDLLDHKPIFSPGYTAVLHAHTAVEDCTIKMLLGTIDPKTGESDKKRPKFVKKGGRVLARIELAQPVCLETFKQFAQLGRFALRDEGKTIALGKITRLPAARDPSKAASNPAPPSKSSA